MFLLQNAHLRLKATPSMQILTSNIYLGMYLGIKVKKSMKNKILMDANYFCIIADTKMPLTEYLCRLPGLGFETSNVSITLLFHIFRSISEAPPCPKVLVVERYFGFGQQTSSSCPLLFPIGT